jgi:uncharacterized Zn finger protein
VPLLDLRLAQECAQVRQGYRTKVPGSSGNTYSVYVRGEESHCSCPGHKYHGKCKHVTAARERACTWTSAAAEQQSLQDNVNMVCPCCTGDTELAELAK